MALRLPPPPWYASPPALVVHTLTAMVCSLRPSLAAREETPLTPFMT